MKESDIMHENGAHWVSRERGKNPGYAVNKPHGACACIEESRYALTSDGLSLAVARCDYLADPAAFAAAVKARREARRLAAPQCVGMAGVIA